MHDRKPEPFGGASWSQPEIGRRDVGVVQTEQLDREAVQVQVVSDVRQVAPSVAPQQRTEIAGSSPAGAPAGP
jgi:hypothetical protein